MDHVKPTEPVTTTELEEARKPWQPLGFEKIDAADAEAFPGTGTTDATIYS